MKASAKKQRIRTNTNGNKIDAWRVDRGLSYKDLGDLIGCTRQYAFKICTEPLMSLLKVKKIIDVSGGDIVLEDFLHGVDYDDVADDDSAMEI